LAAIERRKETPSPDKLAKKFGQNKPRPGAAVVRTPTRTPARPNGTRKSAAQAPRSGRK